MAHNFPVQIAMQATRFLQGAVFYSAFTDTAVGQYVQRHSVAAIESVKTAFMSRGMSASGWDTSWACFEEYVKVFPNPVFQNTIFAMKSHWDWYITKLGGFIEFGRTHVPGPILDKPSMKRLSRIGFESIQDQLSILEKATGLLLNVQPPTVQSLEQMALTRNLGMHRQWEVDDYYMNHAAPKRWAIGDIRTIEISELETWQKDLSTVINETSFAVSKLYVVAPEYGLSSK